MRHLGALLALVIVAAGLGLDDPAGAEDPSAQVSVVWPEVTRFNPTRVSYDAAVTDDGDGHLFWSWGPADQGIGDVTATPVPESGKLTLAPGQEGRGRVRIWSCSTGQWQPTAACAVAAESPELEVWSHLTAQDAELIPQVRGPGRNRLPMFYGPQPPAVNLPKATWELLDTDKTSFEPAVTGALRPHDLEPAGGSDISWFWFTIPATLPTGHYYLDVRLSADTEDFGPLEGSFGASGELADIVVDADGPRLSVGKVPSIVYPVYDDYRDEIKVVATTDEPATGTLEVRNEAGKRVRRDSYIELTDDPKNSFLYWGGHTNGLAIVPEGRYTLTLTARDAVGNISVWTGSVVVSHKALRWTMLRRTVTARASLVGKPAVGRCSALSSPARGGPRGSLGFYSQTKCQGNAHDSVVATNHGMYLPRAFENDYAWVQVIANGGGATQSQGNYLVMGYVDPRNGHLTATRTFGSRKGAHMGERIPTDRRYVFDRKSDAPYIMWSNGLTDGSRYNVRSYTVRVRYMAFR